MALFADCANADSSTASRVTLAAVLALIVAIWFVAVIAMLRSAEQEDRGHLVLIFLVSIAVGAFLFLQHGLQSHDDYLGRFFLSLLVSAVLSVVINVLGRGASLVRGVGLAIAGDVLVPGSFVLLLIGALGLTGTCLD